MKLKFAILSVLCITAGLVSGCEERKSKVREEGDRPAAGEGLVGMMTEGELDRLATSTAAALRESPIAARASAPIHVAPPVWRNATDVPVDQPAEFLDTFTGLVNDRVGANLQFVRRPWVRAEGANTEGLPGADFQSRVSVLPTREGSSRSMKLRTELLRPGSNDVAFAHDDEFRLAEGRVAKAKKRDVERAEKLEKARAEQTPIPAAGGEIRYARKSLRERIRVTQPAVRKLPDGRLQFNARFLATERTKVSVQVFYYDAAGNAVEVARPELREMRKGRPYGFGMTSQLPADSYVILIDKY